jgi:hypothetical protein
LPTPSGISAIFDFLAAIAANKTPIVFPITNPKKIHHAIFDSIAP